MNGNTNGAGATMNIFISYFPLAWSCVRGSSSYFLTLFDPVIFHAGYNRKNIWSVSKFQVPLACAAKPTLRLLAAPRA
jgi:hypothetical protein